MSDYHDPPENETSSLYVNNEASPLAAPSPHRKRLPYLVPLLLIGAFLSTGASNLSPARGSAQPGSQVVAIGALTGGLPISRQQVIAQDQPAVVEVIETDCQNNPKVFGSGVIIDRQGYIVTNYHVISAGQKYQVLLFDNSRLEARLTGTDPADDLAVLKIDTPRRLAVMSIGDSSQLQAGESTLAIGYPEADLINEVEPINVIDGSTVTGGLISALGRQRLTPGGGVILDAIQTDAELNSGNSGGALVNMQGQLIGIPEQILTYEYPAQSVVTPGNRPIKGIGFAIPANRVKFIVPQLIQYGKVVRSGYDTLGALLVSVNPALATLDNLSVDHGAYISNMWKGFPAELAGLRVGDVIVQMNDTPIENAMNLTDALMPEEADATIALGIVRGAQQMRVTVKLRELKPNVKISPIQQCPSTGTSMPEIGKG